MLNVEAKLTKLKALIDSLAYVDFNEPENDDQAFVDEVRGILHLRDLTLDELAELKRPHDEKRAERDHVVYERIRLQHSPGPHNKLFSVTNRSQMRVDVIAMDVETAQKFAVVAGHVRVAENATVVRYSDDYLAKLSKDGSALGRAVREGVPGHVEKRGANVIVGDRVFTPMSVV